MSWEIIQNKNLPLVKDLILKREWACVSFSSRFKHHIKHFNGLSNNCTILGYHEKGDTSIREAIMLTRRGIILPLLERGSIKLDPGYNISKINLPLSEHLPFPGAFLFCIKHCMDRLHSIMGLYDDVATIEGILPVHASHHVDYFLMTVTEDTLTTPDFYSLRDMVIKKAHPKDAEKLFTLQKMYELEEVFIDPSKFSPTLCMSHLKNMLKEELIVYAEKNGIPVAKAGTNARGFIADQIGGVYTDESRRRKGIAQCLMYLLLRNIFKVKKIASLFVKKNNTAAISLYRKLGFIMRENFRISYFFN